MDAKTIKTVNTIAFSIFIAAWVLMFSTGEFGGWSMLGGFVQGMAFTVGMFCRWRMHYPDHPL